MNAFSTTERDSVLVSGLGHKRSTTGQALGTQITPLSWDFRMIDTIRVERVTRLPRLLQRVVYAALLLYIHRWFVKTVKEDFDVWSNRRCIEHPRLIAGEGNMAVYRRWTTQFYPNGDTE